MKYTWLSLLFLPFVLVSQTPSDAFRLSNTQVVGTARMLGLGGTLGPLGPDFGTLSSNPAGLAMYRHSEFNFTPAFIVSKVNSTLKDNAVFEQTSAKFNISNLGFVINGGGGSLATSNWGFGLNRIANFNSELFYTGTSVGSILERFTELAAGNDAGSLDPFEAEVAYNTNAIYEPNEFNLYKSDYQLAPEATLLRNQRITTTGAVHELVVSYAANVNEKFNLGITLGSPVVRFGETKVYEESDAEDLVPYFRRLKWTESLTTKGQGINLKVGAAYRFTQAFRLGAAVHSPSWIGLRDAYKTGFEYEYEDAGSVQGPFNSESPDGEFKYNLITPWKFLVSGAGVFSNKGFVTAEVEAQNFGNSRYSFRNAAAEDLLYQQEINNSISKDYRTAYQLRVGGEYAANKVLRFRLGGGLNTSALSTDTTLGRYWSAGVGFYLPRGFVDLGLRNTRNTSGYTPYQLGTVPAREQLIDNTASTTLFLITIGTHFGN